MSIRFLLGGGDEVSGLIIHLYERPTSFGGLHEMGMSRGHCVVVEEVGQNE